MGSGTKAAAERLVEAEEKCSALLAEMNEIDRQLSGMTPADERRGPLKAKKADVLPRYRGAKEHVKSLRRQLFTIVTVAPPRTIPGPPTELLLELREVLRDNDLSASLSWDDQKTINRFLDAFEPEPTAIDELVKPIRERRS